MTVATVALQRLRALPRWAWLLLALVLIGLPLLLIALAIAAVVGLWSWGGQMIDTGRAELQQQVPALTSSVDAARAALQGDLRASAEALAPQASAAAQAELERLKASAETLRQLQQEASAAGTAVAAGLAANAAAELAKVQAAGVAQVQQGLAAVALPAVDVGGEDPPGIVRLPGFARVEYLRDGDGQRISFAGPLPMRAVADHYRAALSAAGYRAEVVAADASSERLRFSSDARSLELLVTAEGPLRSRLQWRLPANG
jgi:hypothetical protein